MNEADYISNLYGECVVETCICRNVIGWRGKTCPNFLSCDCYTYEQLSAWQKDLTETRNHNKVKINDGE